MKSIASLGCLIGCMAIAPATIAEFTETDLQIAARALSFMEQPISGNVRVGIVYSPASPRSTRQAEQLLSDLGRGLTVGNIVLRPVMVPIADAATADVDLFLLTENMPPDDKPLAAISKARQIPCVTTDIDQVRSGGCIMAIRSKPKVEILINRDAARDSGLQFATAFRVMITEI